MGKDLADTETGRFQWGRNGACEEGSDTRRGLGTCPVCPKSLLTRKGVSLLCILICMSESGLSQDSLEGPDSFHLQLCSPFSQDSSLDCTLRSLRAQSCALGLGESPAVGGEGEEGRPKVQT